MFGAYKSIPLHSGNRESGGEYQYWTVALCMGTETAKSSARDAMADRDTFRA